MTTRPAEEGAILEGSLHSLTARKAALLDREFAAFQAAVSGDQARLATPNRRRASTLRRLAREPDADHDAVVPGVTVPTIRREESTALTSWWAEAPVYDPDEDAATRLWCPASFTEPDEAVVGDATTVDAAAVRREDDWAVVLRLDPSTV